MIPTLLSEMDNQRKRKNGRRLSEEQIHTFVESQANDYSAWEQPIEVRGAKPVGKARKLLNEALRIGGAVIRKAELKDTTIYSLDQDKGFRALIRSIG